VLRALGNKKRNKTPQHHGKGETSDQKEAQAQRKGRKVWGQQEKGERMRGVCREAVQHNSQSPQGEGWQRKKGQFNPKKEEGRYRTGKTQGGTNALQIPSGREKKRSQKNEQKVDWQTGKQTAAPGGGAGAESRGRPETTLL